MGTWGHGNFENDGAQDLLVEISDELFERVVALLQHPRAHEYDDAEIDELFVRIEMIFALHDRNMITSSPGPEALEPLLAPYLRKWVDYQTSAGGGVPAERKQVIERTFEQLLQITNGAKGSGFVHRLDVIFAKMSGDATRPDRLAT